MREVTETVKQLIIINILFFVGNIFIGEKAITHLALFYPENPNFRYWQLFTHLFMHGGFMHIFFNMFALYSFGSTLEYFWGGKKFLFFYISCGLGAALLHTISNYYYFHHGLDILTSNGFSKLEIMQTLSEKKINTLWQEFISVSDFQNFTQAYLSTAVGASGAIFGIIVAFAFMFPNAELSLMFIPVPVKTKYFVPGFVFLELFLGLSGRSIFGYGPGIAHFAHLGGAIFGFFIMLFWKKNDMSNRWN